MKSDNNTPNFSDIKARILIDAALAHYNITLKKSGVALVGACPIHKGSNPRAFTVTRDRKAWRCFGDCDRGGTVLDLVMALENCSLQEAAEILSRRHGLL